MPRSPRATPLKGRQVDAGALRDVRALLGDALRRKDLLIEYLHLLQDRYGCVRHDHLLALCGELRLAAVEGYEVATFYPAFAIVADATDPVRPVSVCEGLPCAVSGAEELARSEAALGRTVRRVPCIGRCDAAPALRRPGIAQTVDATLERYLRDGGYTLLRDCRAGAREPDRVISALEASGLRGLGGAGFPTARKWRAVAAEPGPRYVVLNADESEPGTFKDRWLLERDPHRVLEGLLIACWAIGSREAFIYLRDEHDALRASLIAELAALATAGLAAGTTITLRRGAGAYICGEETAMLESIEGKRGYPRNKPPYPSQVGLFGRPTLIQNVETMYWVRDIVTRGPAWWTAQGRRGRIGMRHFSVSGRVRSPGVYCAPNGVTARELLKEFAGGMADGHSLSFYLPGGAAGGILPGRLADEPLDVDTLKPHAAALGSAGVIFLSEADSPRHVALDAMRFFRDESCGQCTPCREGTAHAVRLMTEGRWTEPELGELASCMADASICGLGQAAPAGYTSVIRFWPELPA